jgi:hypothetical protein
VFTTDLEDGMISGLARGKGDFENALQPGGAHKLLRALSYHTEYLRLKLMAQGRMLRAAGQWGGQKSSAVFDFDFDTFERDFLERIFGEDYRKFNNSSIADMLTTFYATFALHRGAKDPRLIASKPGLGAEALLEAGSHLGGLNPSILYIYRDPRAVISSSMKNDRQEKLTIWARDWLRDQEAIERLAQDRTFPIHSIQYEKLCTQPTEVMADVAEFLDIPFEPTLIEPKIGGTAFMSNSSYGTLTETITTSSIDHWKTTLSSQQVTQIERRLWARMRRAEYEPLTAWTPTLLIYEANRFWLAQRKRIGNSLPVERHKTMALSFALGVITGGAIALALILALP